MTYQGDLFPGYDPEEDHDPEYETDTGISYDPGVQGTLEFERQSFLGSDW